MSIFGVITKKIFGGWLTKLAVTGAAAGGGYYLDHKFNKGKATKWVGNQANDYVFTPIKEKVKDVAKDGLSGAFNGVGDFFNTIVEKVGFGSIIGLTAGFICGGGNVAQRLMVGVAAAIAGYLIEKFFFKDAFNRAANPNALTKEVTFDPNTQKPAGSTVNFNGISQTQIPAGGNKAGTSKKFGEANTTAVAYNAPLSINTALTNPQKGADVQFDDNELHHDA